MSARLQLAPANILKGADPGELALAAPEARAALLGSREEGLTSAEAATRLRQFGPNQPVAPAEAHPLRMFAAQFTHTLALLLWFAAGLSFAARINALGGAILAVVGLNGIFAFVQEYRAEQVVASLMRRVAVQARTARDGGVEMCPAVALVPGDIVHLSAGDIVPADCVLLESDNLTVDLSMLTGETSPVERSAAATTAPPGRLQFGDVPSLLAAGAAVATGSGTAAVFATGPRSSIGQVAGLITGADARPSILERQVSELSRLTAVVAVLTGAVTLGLAAVLTDTSFVPALTFGTGVIVALVPEGLLPTLSVSLAIGARRMAEKGAAVRRLSAVEVVGSVTVICTDKTGTLTENSLTVDGCAAPDGSTKPSPELLLAAVLCNDAEDAGEVEQEDGGLSGDPLDVALWRWAATAGVDPVAAQAEHPRAAAVAFEARKRYMSVSVTVDGRPRTLVKGAPEAVLQLTRLDALPRPLEAAIVEAACRGGRVLLIAAGDDMASLAPIGLISFHDPPRKGVPAAIAACQAAGIRVVMLTGDHPDTAHAVARTIGLPPERAHVVTGPQLDEMPDAAVRALLSRDAVVARVDPEQKLRIVRILQAAGEVVVVTGDGVNDAPALHAADVGVAMGLRGTEVAKQAADIVLADDNFATIVAAIEEGRSIRANIRRFISYVFASNVAELAPFLVFIALPVPLPLAVIQALAVSIGTDLLPALALGAEPPSANTMRASPEPPSRPLLTRRLALRTFFFFGAVEAALGLAGFFAYHLSAGWRFGDSFAPFSGIYHEATTVTFLAIVGGQVACLSAQRDAGLWSRLSLRANRWVVAGLAFELTLAIGLVYIPGLNGLFSMAAVGPQWLLTVPVAAVAFIVADQVRRGVAGLA